MTRFARQRTDPLARSPHRVRTWPCPPAEGIAVNLLYPIAVVLVVLWLLGLVTSYTMGGFVHVLLVIAVVMVLLRLISGRSVV